MSDIKYIIAGGDDDDDDGEHARFGWLVMLRFAVAAAVSVLTITVIALAIHAVLPSQDMSLSVNNGYLGADAFWKQTFALNATSKKSPVSTGNHPSPLNKVAKPATGAAAAMLSRRRRGLSPWLRSDEGDINNVVERTWSLPKDCFLGCSGGDRQPTQVTFEKADRTNLRVILIANNPGSRTKIDCNGTRVGLFDVESPFGQIGDVALKNFTVPPRTTIALQKRLRNTNTSYIWEKYHLASRFSVRVQVTSSVTSYPLGKKGKTTQQTYVCQPVTIGLIEYEATYASDNAQCTAGYPVITGAGGRR